jgi:translation initiation factor IF-2
VLVVPSYGYRYNCNAADDDIMPQTKEAISHASGWSSYYFAINKVDKPMQIQRKEKLGRANERTKTVDNFFVTVGRISG